MKLILGVAFVSLSLVIGFIACSGTESSEGNQGLTSCSPLAVSGISASAAEAGNPPSNAIDGNLATRWSGEGIGTSITVDLGTASVLCSTDIAWYRGDSRRNNYALSVSADGTNFAAVFGGTSSGTTSSFETTSLGNAQARFLRVTVNGNTQNDWASILELRVNGTTSSPPPPPPPPPPPGQGSDPFGVKEIYPTNAGGREWFLPATATQSDAEWKRDGTVTQVSSGVFRQNANQVRSSVHSPAGKAWWRNVEMTGYLRYHGIAPGSTQASHWEWYGRGERHTHNATAGSAINEGVLAPAGTATWPGYSTFVHFSAVQPECLGTAYHGNIYADGRSSVVHIEKEISHTEGYASSRGSAGVSGFVPTQWFGFKTVIRNANNDQNVKIETWVDAQANGTWVKTSETLDSGGWFANNSHLDGCGAAPYSYATDQRLTWAGPLVAFRSDSADYDFKWYSVREIAPLP